MVSDEVRKHRGRKQTDGGVVVLAIKFFDVAVIQWRARFEGDIPNMLEDSDEVTECEETSAREKIIPRCLQGVFGVLDHDDWEALEYRNLEDKIR